VVEDALANLKPADIQKVLHNLLSERVSVRDMGRILEVLSDYGARTKDPEVLTEFVRAGLARNICEALRESDGKLHVVALSPELEELIQAGIERSEGGSYLRLAPDAITAISRSISGELEKLIGAGHNPVILCGPQIRSHVRKVAEAIQPGIACISYNEVVREVDVESAGVVPLPNGLKGQ
jgi:flagellar biosynthesis protein FlhA